MTIPDDMQYVRYLGASETLFWLANQTRPTHFAVAAQVSGGTTVAAWRRALDAVQDRHKLLRVTIATDQNSTPYFRELPGCHIPLRVLEGPLPHSWEREMEAELFTLFPLEDALLVRATLIRETQAAMLLLTMGHAISDGLSAALIVRDILDALAGGRPEALPVPPAQEDLCTWPPASALAPPRHWYLGLAGGRRGFGLPSACRVSGFPRTLRTISGHVAAANRPPCMDRSSPR